MIPASCGFAVVLDGSPLTEGILGDVTRSLRFWVIFIVAIVFFGALIGGLFYGGGYGHIGNIVMIFLIFLLGELAGFPGSSNPPMKILMPTEAPRRRAAGLGAGHRPRS